MCSRPDGDALHSRGPAGRGGFWLVLLLLLSLCGAPTAAAQNGVKEDALRGAIAGRVVDAESRLPLAGASVLLETLGPGTSTRENGSSVARLERAVVTDSSGEYRFERLPLARYRVHVQRIGYLTSSIEVDLRGASATRLSFGLEVEPIRLPPLEITGDVPEPFLRTASADAETVGARSAAARLRQERYLATDARTLTYGDVVEAVTLGESDVFRAIQRIPGVSTRDDYTATLWTRGALWDQTRVYFDGLPLYNPTHAGWLFSAVNPDAIGRVDFLPGTRPARWGEGAAAVLDIASRSGSRDGRIHGVGELSLTSARMALDGSLLDGRVGWMVAGRRTYVDLLGGLVSGLTQDDDLAFPYDFSDLVARVDGETESGWGFAASTILEYDHLRGDLPGLVSNNTGTWGNRAGQVSVEAPLGGLRARFQAGSTRFGTTIVERSGSAAPSGNKTLSDLENLIVHDLVGVELAPRDADGADWAVGVQLIEQLVQYDGMVEGVKLGELTTNDTLRYAALWGDKRWELSPSLALDIGLRAEIGDSVANGGEVRLAPRVGMRYELNPSTLFSAAWSRTYQYTQDISPAAGPIGPQLHLSHWWVVANESGRPAIRADVATMGVERWLGDAWLLGANLYRRRVTGMLVPNPSDGPVATDRRADAEATNLARGLELSVRRLTGRWTTSLGYTLGWSELAADASRATFGGDTTHYEYPSAADVRHSFDATVQAQLDRHWQLGGAFTFASGAPYTRLIIPRNGVTETEFALVGRPNEERTPAYASLDLMVEYTEQLGTWNVTAYAQLRNALNRSNAITYGGSRDCGTTGVVMESFSSEVPLCSDGDSGVKDYFQPGLPRLPLIGVRVAF